MVNKVILVGNLGNDPEYREVGNNHTPCARLSVATSRRRKSADGQYENQTQWHSVICWSKLAEICTSYLRKGSKVYVEGRIEYRSYEKDGQRKFITEIIAENLTMLDSRKEREEQSNNFESAPRQQSQSRATTQYVDESEDVPF